MSKRQLQRNGPLGLDPTEWREYAVDGDEDGHIRPADPADSAATLARLIWSKGTLEAGIFAHNQAQWYVQEVIAARPNRSKATARSATSTGAWRRSATGFETPGPDAVLTPAAWPAPRAVPRPQSRRRSRAANSSSTTPYVWGGGHGSWYSYGYDCSGAVSSPSTAPACWTRRSTRARWRATANRARGRWITIYASADPHHAVIAGLRWDTVGDAQGTGPRWHTEPPSPKASSAAPAGYGIDPRGVRLRRRGSTGAPLRGSRASKGTSDPLRARHTVGSYPTRRSDAHLSDADQPDRRGRADPEEQPGAGRRGEQGGRADRGQGVTQYATLGQYDFVTVVEAPDEQTMAKVSVELGSRGTMTSQTLTAMPAEELAESLERSLEGPGRRRRRARARDRAGAGALGPRARAALRARQRRDRRGRRVPPEIAADDVEAIVAAASERRSTWSWSGPRRRWSPASSTRSRRPGCRPSARAPPPPSWRARRPSPRS